MNYILPKQGLKADQVENLVSKCIRFGRKHNQSFYFLSYKIEIEGKVWFKGFICNPNQLLQTSYWCDTVLPNKSIVVDFTTCLNVPILRGGVDVIVNPNRIMFKKPDFLTETYTA